ncbi:GNAT family N-acetyltransferase [Paeniglutamicibacter antarcticus]|uniref:GNAT family protein n=1 Tax=Paeniglutamicibacter antarcticus TaxID=494023 RepID=A0ABP9TMT7_9MICC
MEICTKRLVLREYCTGDLEQVHAFAADPVVCSFVEWGPNNRAQSAAFLDGCTAEQFVEPRDTWTLAITMGGVVIGSIALMGGESELLQAPGDVEIGYVLRVESWGRGFAMESASALVQSASSALGFTRVLATCRPENAGSVRVLEKSDLQQVDYLHGHKRIDGQARDSLLFATSVPVG